MTARVYESTCIRTMYEYRHLAGLVQLAESALQARPVGAVEIELRELRVRLEPEALVLRLVHRVTRCNENKNRT